MSHAQKKSDETRLVLVEKAVVDNIEDHKLFLTRLEFNLQFDPVKKIVYGFVILVLTAFASGIIALVVKTAK